MDPSKLSQATHNIANFINTRLNPDDRIKEIKNALSTLSTTVQNKLVLQPRNETSKAEASDKTPSLKSLFSSNVSTILKDSKETVSQNFIAKELANAFKNAFPTKAQTKSNDNEPRPFLNSRDTRASNAELEKFDQGLSNVNGEKGLIATAYNISYKEINSKTAEGVRDRYVEQQKIAKKNNGYSKSTDELNDAINNLSSPNLNDKEQAELKSLQLEKYIRSLSPEDQKKFLSLKPEEVKAIQIYTADDAYRHMNYTLDGNIRNKETFESDKPKLRSNSTHLEKTDQAAKQTIELTASALNKLPQYGNTVYKSILMKPDQVEAYRNAHQNGEKIGMVSNKFFSTTKSKEQAIIFNETSPKTLEDGTPLTKVIYQIEPTDGKKLTGADITFLSAKDGEEEVLFNYGSAFISTGIEEVPASENQEAYIIIKFREAPPSSIN